MNEFEIRPLTDQELHRVQEYIFSWSGIHMSDIKRSLISSRLTKQLRLLHFSTFTQYLDYIVQAGNEDEKQNMIEILTTNETYFFREDKHLEFLQNQLLKDKQNSHIRIWSAACSSGEEPYSIAMVCANIFGLPNSCEILASDINSKMIDKAQKGVYRYDRIDHIPEGFLKKYFLKGINASAGKMAVVPEIRKMVKFEVINLMNSLAHLGNFDFIFIRNVMIYFNNETKKDLIKKLAERVNKGGFLITGLSETISFVDTNLVKIGPSIYEKR